MTVGIRSRGRRSDISRVKAPRQLARGLIGASLLVFTAGPVAILAIPWLQRAGLIADTPLWLLVVLLVSCSAVNAGVQSDRRQAVADGRAPTPHRDRGRQHRVGRVRHGLGFAPRDRLRHRDRRPHAGARFARMATGTVVEWGRNRGG